MDNWISIQERLPNKGHTVLVYAPSGLFDGLDVYVAERDYLGNFVACDIEAAQISNVTHWQELPEEPK